MIHTTPTDITETRAYPAKLTMRFPADPDTTRRLEAVRRFQLDPRAPVGWWRRALRLIPFLGNSVNLTK
jgi:hypothetical protein